MGLSARLRREVMVRARKRCEYCGLSDLGQAATFHIDHVIPQVSGGASTLDNLALACVQCSLRKGARKKAADSRTGKMVPLYHPRQQVWNHHFRWSGTKLVGITASGRATVAALHLNSLEHLLIRGFEYQLGRHPPPRHV
jgi:hypothetical protein